MENPGSLTNFSTFFLCKIEYSKSNFRMDSIATTVYILDDDGILYGLIFFFSFLFFLRKHACF